MKEMKGQVCMAMACLSNEFSRAEGQYNGCVNIWSHLSPQSLGKIASLGAGK